MTKFKQMGNLRPTLLGTTEMPDATPHDPSFLHLARYFLLECKKCFRDHFSHLVQGASKNVTFQEWDKIWSINKRLIDPVCPRHTAVETRARVPVQLINGPADPEVCP
jgi:hypothetical protein